MKFFGKTHITILFGIAFAFAVWLEIQLIKIYYVIQNRQEPFPCTYISGECTIKPTYKNCEKLNLIIPEDECERILNGRK